MDYESALRDKTRAYMKVMDDLQINELAEQTGIHKGTLYNFVKLGRSLKITDCLTLLKTVDPRNTILDPPPPRSTDAKILLALASLPTPIVLTDADGHSFYFQPQFSALIGADGIAIRYERFYCESGGKTAALDYVKDGEVFEIIASWKFPKDCDFCKELGKFLDKLKSDFSEHELYFEKGAN